VSHSSVDGDDAKAVPANTDSVVPPNPGRQRIAAGRRRRRSTVIASLVVVAVLIVAAGVFGYVRVLHSDAAHQQMICAGLPDTSGAGFHLVRAADKDDRQHGRDECVGWTVTRNYTFGTTDKQAAAVLADIVRENNRIATARPAVPYVRIALMTPMSATADSGMAGGPILHALEGAYTAQLEANEGDAHFGDRGLRIQLVLANNGSNQDLWPGLVPELVGLDSGAHPLVAVTGLGVSVPDTRAAATALGDKNIPSVGAVLTADDMTTRGAAGGQSDDTSLFKVSTSNHQYALALKAALTAQHQPITGFLVWDRNDDNYVRSLAAAFKDAFDTKGPLGDLDLEHNGDPFTGTKPPEKGAPQLFDSIVQAIAIEKPSVVFYAGRDADLPRLIRALKDRPESGPRRPIILATGTTGLLVSTSGKQGNGDQPLTLGDLRAADVGILDASTTDPDTWLADGPGTPTAYADFYAHFTGSRAGDAQLPAADLEDGYAIMHHDGVLAAVVAARRAYSDNVNQQPDASVTADLPSATEVRNELGESRDRPFQGASGQFYFEEQVPANDLWPINKPVPVLRFGPVVTASTWRVATGPYLTACQALVDPGRPLNDDYLTKSC
jgi:hypothetical protein